MINTDKTFNGKPVSYEILTNGYKIYLDSNLWIEQVGEYSKPIDKNKSYEENCLAQINEITTEILIQETLEEKVEKNTANIETNAEGIVDMADIISTHDEAITELAEIISAESEG